MRRYILPLIALILVFIYFAPYLFEKEKDELYLLKNKDAVKGITVKRGDIKIELNKEGGSWWIKGSRKYRADSSKIEELLDTLVKTRLENPVTEDKEKYSLYRVDDSGDYIELDLGTTKKRIYTGKSGPRYSLYYLRPDDDETVYLVKAGFIDLMPKTVNDFRDRMILSLNPDSIKGVHWKEGDKEFEIKKSDARWKGIKEGEEAFLDEKDVSEYLKDISSISATGFPEDDKLPQDTLEAGLLKIKADREYTLNLYKIKDKEDYFLRHSEDVYKINKFIKERLFREIKPASLEEKTEK